MGNPYSRKRKAVLTNQNKNEKDQSTEQKVPEQSGSATVNFLNKWVLGPKTQIKTGTDVEEIPELNTEQNNLAESGVLDSRAENKYENNPLNESGNPATKTKEPAFKEVTGHHPVSKSYKVYASDGTLLKSGKGNGPSNVPEGSGNVVKTDAKFEDGEKTTNDSASFVKYLKSNDDSTKSLAAGMEEGAESQYRADTYKDFFQRNILHDYDAVTYNFRLSMLSEAGAVAAQNYILEGNSEDKGFKDWDSKEFPQVVIAETGSTVLSINDVQINAVAGPINNGKRLTGAVDFQMVIQQPLNASFTDILVNAAVSLGLPDGLKASYLLELKFVGRDPKTGAIVQSIPTTARQFLIEIISVEASVDTNGSTYNIRAARAGDKALRQKTFQTDRPMQLTNIKTVEDLTNKITEAMNLNEIDKLAIEKGILDEYYVTLDKFTQEEIGKDPIIDTATLEKPTTNQSQDDKDDTGLRLFKIPQGTSIDRILEFGITHSKKLQSLAKGLKAGADPDSSDSKDIDKFVKHIYHVKVDTKNIGWDVLRNDYAREYYYTISLFPTIRPEISPGIWADQNTVAYEKVISLLKGTRMQNKSRPYKALSKRYDYLFTGLNDKVLRFDIKYNNQFFFALHSYRGLYSKLDDTTHVKINKSAETLAKFKEQQKEVRNAWRDYVQFKADYITVDPESVKDGRGTAWDKFAAARQELLNLYVEGIENKTFEGDLALAQNLSDVSKAQQLAEIERAVNDDRPASEPIVDPDALKEYAELIDRQTVAKAIDNNQKSFQIMWGAVPEDFRNKFNSTGETPGKGHADSVIEASLADFEADLVAMDMDIKGDPFWLESERDPAFSSSASYYEGENYLLFRAITSQGEPSLDTGIANPNREGKEQMLNGVYAVVQILNSFSGGQFTQNIKGVKEAFITDISILEQYKEDQPYGNT